MPNPDDPPRHIRLFVHLLLVLLILPGVIGFDAWPLSGWRLFSLSRDGTENRWYVEAFDSGRRATTLQLDEMALGYRHAQWLLPDLPRASDPRREEVCAALLRGARLDVPGAVELRVIRDRQRLERHSGQWTVVHDREVIEDCGTGGPRR